MKFAKYWSEASVSVDEKIFGSNKISTWGASNESESLASVHAMARAATLGQLIGRGFDALREYEYWNGFIKEEVIEEVKDSDGRILAVLTRNSYGATVLNSESVLFGDIDVSEAGAFSKLLNFFGKAKKDKAYYIAKIEQYQKQNPEYTLKVYETFAGLRVVVTNQIFDNYSDSVKALFSALDVDPLYVLLCKAQACYRARLTPKPWRMGVARPASRFPRLKQSELDEFSEWLANYQTASRNFSVVKVVGVFGIKSSHADVERVLAVHDQYARRGGVGLA